MFDILKLSISKHLAAIFPLRNSKKGCPVRQPLLPSKPLYLLQYTLSLELPSLVFMLCDFCLVYVIYLIPEFLAHCHVRMLRLIVGRSVRLD